MGETFEILVIPSHFSVDIEVWYGHRPGSEPIFQEILNDPFWISILCFLAEREMLFECNAATAVLSLVACSAV